MNGHAAKEWLACLKSAWEKRDPDAAMALLAKNVIYWESPFDGPYTDHKDIRKLWEEVPETQNKIKVSVELIAQQDEINIAHWHATFIRLPSGKRAELDGLYQFVLDENGLCVEFHQWWNSKT